MTIRCRCSGCRAKFDAPQKYAGRQVKCPKCGERFTVEATRRKSKSPSQAGKSSASSKAGAEDSAITQSSQAGLAGKSATDSVEVSMVGTVDLVDFVPAPPAADDTVRIQADEDTVPVLPLANTDPEGHAAAPATLPATTSPATTSPAATSPAASAPPSTLAPVSTLVEDPANAPPQPPPASRRRIQPPAPPASKAPMMAAAFLTFCAAAALVVGIYFIENPAPSGPQMGSSQPKLNFVWPVATREGAEIFINGRRMLLHAQGEIEFTLQPGAYDIRLSRQGYRTIEARVDLQTGIHRQFEPIWEVDHSAVAATPGAKPRGLGKSPAGSPRKNVAPLGFAGWLQNYEAARTQAAAEKKNLLIAFVNSADPQTQMMVRSVFARPEFRTHAAGKYVLLVIDFPESRAGIARLEDPAHNEAMLRRFDIVQFPTFIFADSAGDPFAFEVSTWTLDDIARFESQRAERDRLFAAVDAASGDGRHLAAVQAADFLFANQISRFYKDRGEQWLSLAESHDSGNAQGQLEKAFFVYWSSNIEIPDKPHRLPRWLVRFNQWKQKHTFKDPRLTLNFYSIAATAMFDIGNPQGARDYLKEAQALFTTNSAYQRQLKQLLAASEDLKG